MRSRLPALVAMACLFASFAPVSEAHAAPDQTGSGTEVSRVVEATKEASDRATAELALPGAAGAAADETVQTASATVAEDVAVAAVVLPAGAEVDQVFLRSVSDGEASEWTEVHLEESAPGTTLGTEPLAVTSVDSVEVAVVAPEPVAASLQVYTSAATASDAVVSQFASESPQIRSRAAWQADETLVRRAYTPGAVTGAMIHHTAMANDYKAEDVPRILRSIQSYHINGRGWNDIAYNVLVDKFGRAWEGRGGGVTNAITGGHALGATNYRTFGIALMGDFSKAQPPAAMLTTMERVIAWKFKLHGVDPAGRTWGSSGQDGGSPYLPAISGHRDENATDCPGANVYSRMPTIRANVKKAMAGEFASVKPLPRDPRRLAGPNRYGTAVEVSFKAFPNGSPTVFLATGAEFADALAAGPWANQVKAPVLLTSRDSLPAETRTELTRLAPTRVVVLGGTGSISGGVADAVARATGATIERVEGATRYQTAAQVSAQAFETSEQVYLASGSSFPDALVGGPLAAGKAPLLLTPSKGALPAEVTQELARLQAKNVTLLGGPGAIPTTVEETLVGLGLSVDRIAGTNRYDTALKVAQRAFPGTPGVVYLASGENYPDALVSIGLQTARQAPLLLTRPHCLPPATVEYLRTRPGAKATLIGGAGALPIDADFLQACEK